MKSNKGMGIISLICIVVVIAIITGVSVYFARLKYNEAKVQTIKTDMLLVQWKVKSYIDSQIAEKVEINYLGVKISEVTDNNLINTFKEKNVIDESEYEKYYMLSDEELNQIKSTVSSPEGSYYLVNYDNYEVIITGGCKISDGEILYKLSDIEKRTSENEENTEQAQVNEEIPEGEE